MNIRRLKIVGTTLVAAAAVFFLAGQVSAAPGGSAAIKLEGAWIAKVQELPLVWTLVLSSDASGRVASLHGSIDVGTGPAIPGDSISPLIGEVVMTGPNTAKFTSLWYEISDTPAPHVVFIGMNNGEILFLDPDHAMLTNNLAVYLPSADADGDGIPDPGATPLPSPTTLHAIATRLSMPR